MTIRLPVHAPECAVVHGRRPLWSIAYSCDGPCLHLPYNGGDLGEYKEWCDTRVFFNRRAYPELKGKRIKAVDLERDESGVWVWRVTT